MKGKNGLYWAFAFRYIIPAQKYKEEQWGFALTLEEVNQSLAEMHKKDPAWEVETVPLYFFEDQLRNLSARYLGSKKSLKKSIASRENGKKGGRPRHVLNQKE